MKTAYVIMDYDGKFKGATFDKEEAEKKLQSLGGGAKIITSRSEASKSGKNTLLDIKIVDGRIIQ